MTQRPATRKDGGPWDVVHYCWFRQSRTEYMAAAQSSELLHWALQCGVSPELAVRLTRLVADEVRHAAMCHELYLHVGGPPQQVPLQPRQLRHQDDPDAPMVWRAVTASVELACEETVALPVFRARERNATDPKAAEVIAIILRDEATHRRLGWDLVDEFITLLGQDAVRAWARPRIPFWLRTYLLAEVSKKERVYTPNQLAVGLIDRREHWQLMVDCVREQVIPRFQKRGLLEDDATFEELQAELRAQRAQAQPQA